MITVAIVAGLAIGLVLGFCLGIFAHFLCETCCRVERVEGVPR